MFASRFYNIYDTYNDTFFEIPIYFCVWADMYVRFYLWEDRPVICLLLPENCDFTVIVTCGGCNAGSPVVGGRRRATRSLLVGLCLSRFLRRPSVGTDRQVGLPRLRRDIRPATMHLAERLLQYMMRCVASHTSPVHDYWFRHYWNA